MSFTEIIAEQTGDVAVISLNAPETLNAVTPAMIDALSRAFESCAQNARVIILTAKGRAFCSGANLTGDGLKAAGELPFDAGLMLETHINPLVVRLRDLGVPWIAAVRGAVAGVGCSIALAADMIIASDTAYFLQAFSRIGLVPDGGATWLLTRALGRPRAMELMLLGDRLAADTALQWGLINRVVPDENLEEAALALASRISQGPTRAYALTRALSWAAAEGALESVLIAERDAQREAGLTRDAAEGIAAFATRRAPVFSGV